MKSRSLFVLIFSISIAVAISGCVASTVPPLPPPPEISVLPTTTSSPDYSAVSLPRVNGTTTTTNFQVTGGRAGIRGRVTLAGAPIEGAVVRVERLIGEQVVTMTLTTNAEGLYALSNVQGGRYRVRAFRSPDLAQLQATAFFLPATETRTQDLSVEQYSGVVAISSGINPSPPVLGQKANLVVAVTVTGVDSTGTVRALPVPNIPVTLVSSGGRVPITQNPATTDAAGKAVWTLQCNSLEKQGLNVLLPDGTTHAVDVPACTLPPTTTTTAPTTTTTTP